MLFRGGIPYVLSVNRLMEAFPVGSLSEGRVIPHSELEQIVNEKRGEQRYYNVVNCWLAKVKNSHGIFMVWEPSVGIKILDPAGILNHAENKTRQKIRQTGKAIKAFAWVDRKRLDTLDQQRLDHKLRATTLLNDALQTAQKNLIVKLAPIQSLPQARLTRKA